MAWGDVATWILADAHGGADPERDRALVELLDAARLARADLLILGDLFAAWIALDRHLTAFQREVLEAIRVLRRAGQSVRFVVGNRDYLVREGQLGTTFDEVFEDDVLIPLGGVPTWVSHGDRINPRDHLYRVWHRVSRSLPARRLLMAVPGAVGRRLAERTERALRGTNLRYKTGALPMNAIAELGRHAARAGASRALLGHFHHDRAIDVPGGVPVIIAPAWLEHGRVLVVEEDGALVSREAGAASRRPGD
jgi:UDP-2,3-diacylglucosamine hydrolase